MLELTHSIACICILKHDVLYNTTYSIIYYTLTHTYKHENNTNAHKHFTRDWGTILLHRGVIKVVCRVFKLTRMSNEHHTDRRVCRNSESGRGLGGVALDKGGS